MKLKFSLRGTCLAIFSVSLLSAFGTDELPSLDSFVAPGAIVSRGLMNSIIQDDRYFLEIPDRVMGRDLLSTITIIRGATRKERGDDDRFGYGGDSMFSRLFRLQKVGRQVNILFPENNWIDSTSYSGAFLANVATPVYQALPAVATTDSSVVVEITQMLMADDQLFTLKGGANELHIGGALPQFTKIKSIKSFPMNINFLSLRSYTLQRPAKDENPNSQWEVSASWLLLPEKPMQPRLSDARVGFFNSGLFGLSTRKDRVEISTIANRWRLEPREEDMERYLRGELVAPKKPIVFYISHSVPDYLKPYFVKAVDAWKGAFECAGFKDAIHAEIAPDDSLYDEGDIRYPLISYKASPIPNAYGPHVVDPRSGEIITSHVAIYHSVLDLIQRWYFVMCSQIDPRARRYPLQKDVVGKLAQVVLTHEIGHTLGLRHNFIASTLFPVDSLRSADFIHQYGLGGSIMDYQRYNYIPQPGDKVSPDDLLPRIGNYDRFAIEWGYRYMPDTNITAVADSLRRWVTACRAVDRRVMYLEESQLGDPRVQSEDSGDDDIKANTYGMKNLEYIMNHLEEWTQTTDKDYYPLRRRYLSVQNQYWNYIGHVVRYIAGHYLDNPDRDEKLNAKTPVPREQQLRALDFLKHHLFTEPGWLWRPGLMEKTGCSMQEYAVSPASRQIGILFLKYGSMADSNRFPGDLIPDELFDFIYDNLYGCCKPGQRLSVYRRGIQRNFLTDLTLSAENPYTFGIGVGTRLKLMLAQIKEYSRKSAALATDSISKAHYEAMMRFIQFWEDGSNRHQLRNNKQPIHTDNSTNER